MTKIEFDKCMGSLFSFYGNKSYETQRIEVFWNDLKNEDANELMSAFEMIKKAERVAPMIPKIRQYLQKVKQVKKIVNDNNSSGAAFLDYFGFKDGLQCNHCKGKGFVIYTDKKSSVAFACKYCTNGEAQYNYASHHLKQKMDAWKQNQIGSKPVHLCPHENLAKKLGWELEK